MTRRFAGDRLVLASHNPAKLIELSAILSDLPIRIDSARDLDLSEPEETGQSFAENATLKALAASKATRLPALADDSGLEIGQLDGRPGIHSARWAGPERDFAAAMARIEGELRGIADRHAAFVAVLALAWPDGHCVTVEGRVEGLLIWPPRGTRGFGYDPMFQPQSQTRTFGEMTAEEKQRFSHRAAALRLMRERHF